jgi:predicted nucleic acid-binding protein
MRRLFVDTFYLIALSSPRDQWHQRVMVFSQSLTDYRLYTVDEVLAEFLTFCSTAAAHVRTQAARTVRNALNNR